MFDKLNLYNILSKLFEQAFKLSKVSKLLSLLYYLLYLSKYLEYKMKIEVKLLKIFITNFRLVFFSFISFN